MSRANLEQFLEQVADSEELQAKIGDEIEAESLVALGAECGCEFTLEDLIDAGQEGVPEIEDEEETAELSDEELEEVSGGWGVFNRYSPKRFAWSKYKTFNAVKSFQPPPQWRPSGSAGQAVMCALKNVK